MDKNLSTGDESRISQRGQEFELNRHESPEPLRPGNQTARQPPSILEQLHNYQQQIAEQPADGLRPADLNAADPYAQDAGPEDLPMEAARPTARSHEARSHESPAGGPRPAGPKPRHRQAAFDTQNATVHPQNTGEYETTPDPPKTPHSEEKQRFKHHYTTAEAASTPQSPEQPGEAQQPPGRLKFTGKQPQAPPDAKAKQHGTKYQQKFTPDATIGDPAIPEKPSRLQFTPDEQPSMPDKKLAALQNKADRTAAKLEKARDKLPSRTRIKTQRVYDEAKGKGKTKFRLEKEIIPLGAKKPQPILEMNKEIRRRTGQNAANEIHQKIAEVEKENVGLEAAHKLEQAAEDVFRGAKSARTVYRHVRERKYRRVAKLETQAAKAKSKLSYRQAVNSNPKLKGKTLSRQMQKKKIKREYAAAARETAKKSARAAKKAGQAITDAAKTLVAAVKSHPAVVGGIAGILLIAFMLSSFMSSCSNMALGGIGAIFSSSHLAEDADIDISEVIYTEWETDLRLEIENAESDRPGYDEYRYNVDDIGHDPHELLSYLSARYRDFTLADVESELREIFAEQYQLEFVEEVEIRYADPSDSDDDGDYEPYEWHILNVNLTSKPLSDVIAPRISDDEREIYDLIMDTGGNRQYTYSPFEFDWLPYVTSNYGWRLDPFTGAKSFHTGVDVGVPIGTAVVASHDGVVSSVAYGSTGYGYQVVLEGEDGWKTRYAHLNEILVVAGQEVKRGDIIARTGDTGNSTGPHLHYEVIVNGNYLNPLYFAQTTVN